MTKFLDRKEVGERLAERLAKYKNIKNGIVLALPRGGVVVGAEISKALNLPLDIIVTRKIGAPYNEEYAIAAVSAQKIVRGEFANIDEKYIQAQTQKQHQEIKRRMSKYRGERPYPNLKNKIVILVDDGLATGLTAKAAIEEIKTQKPAKIILAAPVAPPETIEKLKNLVDKTIILKIEPQFWAVGQFYKNFEPVSDSEVKELLNP